MFLHLVFSPALLLVMLYCFCRTSPGVVVLNTLWDHDVVTLGINTSVFLCLSGLQCLELCDLQRSKRNLQTERVVFLHVINKSIKQPNKVWL